MLKIHSIKYNFLMNLLLTGTSTIFPLITFPIVSRALNSEMYGLCNWASSIVSWLSLVAMLGVNRYGIREVSRNRDDNATLVKITTEITLFTFITTAIVYLCFIFSVFSVPTFAENRTLFIINGVTLLCNTLGVGWFFQGVEQYTYITIRGIIIKIISFVGVVLLVHVPDDYLIYAALVAFSSGIANIINFLYMLHLLKRASLTSLTLNEKEHVFFASAIKSCIKKTGGFSLTKHIKPMFNFFVIAGAISVYTMLDTTMLGFLSTNQQVGLYSAAMNVKSALVGIVSALTGVLLPRASYLIANNKKLEFIAIIQKCVLLVIAVSVVICTGMLLFATPLISWYAGADFSDAGPILSITGLAVLPICLSIIFCDAVMIPLKLEKYCTRIYIIAAIINFSMNLILIPRFGGIGAAISMLSVETIITVIEFFIIGKYIWGNKLVADTDKL